MPVAVATRKPAAPTRAPRAEPAFDARTWWLALPLGLALLVLNQYQLESQTFERVALLAFAGFFLHALVPLQYRLTLFAALSLTAIAIVVGPLNGLMLVSVGVLLIAICHLPVRLAARVTLLLILTVILAGARAQLFPVPWSAAVWPVLGSMFMFRLALYLYAIEKDKLKPTWTQALSYFFMLPNVCFPLYPVIDYGTFARNYYDAPAYATYERGVQWITRGLVHLLLYRFVYLNLTLPAAEVTSLGDVLRHITTTFLLYLRVSGQFHLIIGILHLFGMRLPETHRLYYLASSFNDFWRRINIYWKDFMMKLVYYPSFFRFRHLGTTRAMIVATLFVFVITWLLHSYQWFWLRGGFPLTPQDAVFWALLGMLVVANTVYETRHGRARSLRRNTRWSLSLALRTLGTYLAICVLWSLWSATEPGEWVWMWLSVRNVGASDLLLIGAILAVGLIIGGRVWDTPVIAQRPPRFYELPLVRATATLVALLIVAQPTVHERAGPQLAGVVSSLKVPALNDWDATLRRRGYYEDLDNVGLLNPQTLDVRASAPADWKDIRLTQGLRQRPDFLQYDLQPNVSFSYKRKQFSTNSMGLRDREYSVAKPEGVYRIALLGPSLVMGDGVADQDRFDALLEDELNRAARAGRSYEVINFGVGGYSLLQQVAMLDDRAAAFDPDMIVLTYHLKPAVRMIPHLSGVTASRTEVPYADLARILEEGGVIQQPNGDAMAIPFAALRSIAQRLGLETSVPGWEREIRLRLLTDDLVNWSMQRVAAVARELGAVPALLCLEEVSVRPTSDLPALRVAAQQGFRIFNLFDVYSGHDPKALRIADWDDHPNELGHQLIAQRLLAEIRPALDAERRISAH